MSTWHLDSSNTAGLEMISWRNKVVVNETCVITFSNRNLSISLGSSEATLQKASQGRLLDVHIK